MKRVSMAGLGAVALLASVSLTGVIPGVPSIGEMGKAIAQSIQKQPQMQLRLDAAKQVVAQDSKGEKKVSWQPLEGEVIVRPGDLLRYTIKGENKSPRPLKNLTINQPIPQGMVYQLKSADVKSETTAKISYSVDGGKNFVENPTVQVKLASGKVETQAAPAKAYTHIRWTFGNSIPANTAVQGTYELQVR
jgi:uncharacterized repeat protein (TIGR01451 family)